MGNTLLQPNVRQTNPLKSFEEFLLQNPDLANKDYLSENKYFRTARFSIKNDAKILIKVYLKRAALSIELLNVLHHNFLYIREKLTGKTYPNLFPAMKFVNFDQPDEDFIAVIRQSLHNSLRDRFHALPKPSNIETLWILTQVIIGLYNLHCEGLFHGDLKTSNILLTTWNHAYITDFACGFKPFYIKDISVFRNFFFTSEENCALAPEKFFNLGSEDWDLPQKLMELKSDLLEAQQKMDLFSLGCLLAETFLQGQALFTYEQLQLYHKGLYDPIELIKKIKDESLQKLIICLINKDPGQRMRIEEVLKVWFQKIVHSHVFDVLYYIDSTMNGPAFSLADERIALFKRLFPLIYEEFIEFNQANLPVLNENLPIPLQELKIPQYLVKSLKEIRPNLFELLKKQPPAMFLGSLFSQKEENIKGVSLENMDNCKEKDISLVTNSFKLKKYALNKGRKTLDFEANAYNKSIEINKNEDLNEKTSNNLNNFMKGNDSLDLILIMICSNIRNLRYSSSKLVALELLQKLSNHVSDSSKFHIICPYLSTFFDDVSKAKAEGNEAFVISIAFTMFCEILSSIKDPFETVNDCKLYNTFVWVNIRKVIETETFDLLQAAFAKNVHIITETCRMFLLEAYTKKTPNFSQTDPQYLKDLDDLKKTLLTSIHNILSPNNYDLQEILLNNLHNLCCNDMFDTKLCSEDLMPLIISCLNKKKQVCLSIAPNIARNFFKDSVNNMLKPCLEACLYDSDEMVVLETIRCFKEMVRLKLLERKNEEDLLKRIIPLVLYPNLWIREEALGFLATLLEKYSPVEIYCYLQPLLGKYFKENMLLNKDILEYVLPDMVDKETVKALKSVPKKDRKFDSFAAELLFNEYFTHVSLQQSHAIDSEAKNSQEKPKGNIFNLSAKINSLFLTLLLENYPENVVSLMGLVSFPELKDKKDWKLDDLIECYKTFLLKEHQVDITSPDLSSTKSKVLSSWALKISRDWESSLTKSQRNAFVARLLRATVLDINETLFKMRQFDIKNENLGLEGLRNEAINVKSKPTGGNKGWRPMGSLVTTIYEHDDVVSCLELLKDNRRFISGGYDGFVRVFDVEKIENDLNSDSVIAFQEEPGRKVKALKLIDQSVNLLVGNDKDNINCYNIGYLPTFGSGNYKSKGLVGQYSVQGEVRKLENLRMNDERCFIYITRKGELGIQDFRSKDAALKFYCGMERGMISTMLVANNNNTACIATLNGYLLLYDIRCNLIYNLFQLNDHDNKPLPIINLSQHSTNSNFNDPTENLVTISFGSHNHELCYYDVVNNSSDYINPKIYVVSTYEENPIFKIPYLCRKDESFTNYNYKYSERSVYEYFSMMSSYNDVLSFLEDPLMKTQSQIKQHWMDGSKHCLSRITKLFEYKNIVKKCFGFCQNVGGSSNSQKILENVLLTVGNDRNIRYWTLQGDGKGLYDKKKAGGMINNADAREKFVKQEKNGDIIILHEYERTLNSVNSLQNANKNEECEYAYSERAAHKDDIEDILFIERERGALVVTASRDHSIKVWK